MRAQGIVRGDTEIWFGDADRDDQKNKSTRRWARLVQGPVRRSRMKWQDEGRRGSRSAAPQEQRAASTYIFAAICPQEGRAAGLILPWCNTHAMTLHLVEISTRVDPGHHAALLMDQAGWHMSAKLVAPDITVVALRQNDPS